MRDDVILLNAGLWIPKGGKKGRGRPAAGSVPNVNASVHVVACLCQKQSFTVGKHSKRQEISSTNRGQTSSIYIPSWFPTISVDIDQASGKALIMDLCLSFLFSNWCLCSSGSAAKAAELHRTKPGPCPPFPHPLIGALNTTSLPL